MVLVVERLLLLLLLLLRWSLWPVNGYVLVISSSSLNVLYKRPSKIIMMTTNKGIISNASTNNDNSNVNNNYENNAITKSTNSTTNTLIEEDKNETTSDSISMTITPEQAAIDFARMIGRLKITPRTGWVRHGVPKYESVADHSWRVAALSFLLLNNNSINNKNSSTDDTSSTTSTSNNNNNNNDSTPNIDVTKCIQLAVVHDIAEYLVGDITPDDNVAPNDKKQMEHHAVEILASKLAVALQMTNTTDQSPTNPQSNEQNKNNINQQQESSLLLTKLFQEYEERTTDEAKAVKDLDLLDMIIQASEYEERFDMDLSDFFDGTPPSRFRNPTIRAIAEEVHKQRSERQKNKTLDLSTSSTDDENSVAVLTSKDMAFVEEYAKASTASAESIQQIILTYKQWNK